MSDAIVESYRFAKGDAVPHWLSGVERRATFGADVVVERTAKSAWLIRPDNTSRNRRSLRVPDWKVFVGKRDE